MIKETMTSMERVQAAINLEPVDHVPVLPLVTLFPARYKGMTNADAVRNPDLATRAIIEVFDEVGGWDGMVFSGYRAYLVPPKVSAVAMVPQILQPGRELPENAAPQFDEREAIAFEDYDLIIKMGWKGFAEKHYQRFLPFPEDKIIAWAERQFNYYIRDMKAWEQKGIPCLAGAMTLSPLMFFSLKRTLVNFTLDLHRHPDKVAAALDAVVGDLIDDALYAARLTGLPCILLALERGGGFYYPLKIFERFEFPYIKKMVGTFASEGFVTILHFDNDWTLNLPYLKELPRAKCVCELDGTTDILKAKDILRGHMCIMGDVPASLSALGTPEEMEAYCKKRIEVVGKGGGYILSSGCELPPDTKFQNFKAMIDAAKTYRPPA
ncbi:MAG: hypothetical protein FJ008_05775 [Chloroflexi bacterium]|nr:hypothetical protein [Chloroflexota bacterium]